MEEQFLRRRYPLRGYDVIRVQYGGAPLRHLLAGMSLLEQLFRYLAEVVYETDRRIFLKRIVNAEIN